MVVIDGFETGDLNRLPDSGLPAAMRLWSVSSAAALSGTFAVRSGAIGDSQSTTLQVVQDCAAGNISFWYSVGSEQNYDFLDFYVDGVRQSAHDTNWSGVVP